MKSKFLVLLVLFSVLLSGCATILSDETVDVNIRTTTSKNYTATIEGQNVSIPGVVQLERKNQDYILRVKEGSCNQDIVIRKEVNKLFFVNIISGGVSGSTTDYLTEDMWDYTDAVEVNC